MNNPHTASDGDAGPRAIGPVGTSHPVRRRTTPEPFPVTVSRIPGFVPVAATAPPATAHQRARHRHADTLTADVHDAMLAGEHDRRLAACPLRITDEPTLQRLLQDAPRIAATADGWAVRTTRTRRGTLAAIRLHGSDWSLVLGAMRPLCLPMLVICDKFAIDDVEPYVWNILDRDWIPELVQMSTAILDALEPAAHR